MADTKNFDEKMEKTDNFSLSAFVFIFNKSLDKILLVKRNEEKRKKWAFDWGIVGGKVEPGEYSIDAATREVREEVGIKLDKRQLRFLFFEERPSKIHTPAVHFLFGAIVDEKTKIVINAESDQAKWFDIHKLPDKMADSPERILTTLNALKNNLEPKNNSV